MNSKHNTNYKLMIILHTVQVTINKKLIMDIILTMIKKLQIHMDLKMRQLIVVIPNKIIIKKIMQNLK